MSQRHKDAIGIQQGACNLRAIAGTLIKAIDEAREAGAQPAEDSAIRLIMHQMAFLCRTDRLDFGFLEYDKCIKECEEAL